MAKAHLECKLATGIQDKKLFLFYTTCIITGGGSKEFSTSKKGVWFLVEVRVCGGSTDIFVLFQRSGWQAMQGSAAGPDWRVAHH